MKNTSSPAVLLLMIFFVGCESSPSSSSDNGSASIMGSKGKLYIEYRENNPEIRAARYNSINNETDRFYYMKQNFEKVFERELAGYELDFRRFPANLPGSATVLELTFLSLRASTPIELELRMWAILKQGGDEDDFRISVSRIVPQRPASSSSVNRDLNQIYSEMAKDVAKDLAESL